MTTTPRCRKRTARGRPRLGSKRHRPGQTQRFAVFRAAGQLHGDVDIARSGGSLHLPRIPHRGLDLPELMELVFDCSEVACFGPEPARFRKFPFFDQPGIAKYDFPGCHRAFRIDYRDRGLFLRM